MHKKDKLEMFASGRSDNSATIESAISDNSVTFFTPFYKAEHTLSLANLLGGQSLSQSNIFSKFFLPYNKDMRTRRVRSMPSLRRNTKKKCEESINKVDIPQPKNKKRGFSIKNLIRKITNRTPVSNEDTSGSFPEKQGVDGQFGSSREERRPDEVDIAEEFLPANLFSDQKEIKDDWSLGSLVLLSTSDFISPVPMNTYSPRNEPQTSVFVELHNVLDELLYTEDHYVLYMQTLINLYLDPLEDKRLLSCGLPLTMLRDLVDKIIQNHKLLLQNLRRTCAMNALSSISITEKVTTVICDEAIDVDIYREYCNNYEDVLNFIKEYEYLYLTNRAAINHEWVKGWENFLQATQSASKSTDLSFNSLMQQPISRVGKYRLFLEALNKLVHKYSESTGQYTNICKMIDDSCQTIKEKLMIVNENVGKQSKVSNFNLINKYFNFEKVHLGVPLSLQFFGSCIMVGSVIVIWVENDIEKAHSMAALFYQRQLILTDLHFKNYRKSNIRFIIPFSLAWIYSHPNQSEEGIFTSYPYSLKLGFQDRASQYEMLLCFMSEKETSKWRNNLLFLIRHLKNKRYENFWTVKKANLLLLYPSEMQPYKITSTNLHAFQEDHACYFNKVIEITIATEFHNTDNKNGNPDLTNLPKKLLGHKPEKHFVILEVTNPDTETRLKRLQSTSVLHTMSAKEYKKTKTSRPSIYKSTSWSQLKHSVGSSLRNPRAYNNTANIEVLDTGLL